MSKIEKVFSEYKEKYNKVALDLACGDRKHDDYYIGVDIAETSSADIVYDLRQYPWPIESGTVDEINCSHYVEHIPHDIHNPNDSRDGFIQFFDEIYRILKPGGKVNITCPYYTSIRAYGDPTHCRYIGEWSFYYLSKDWIKANKLEHYGINADFDMKYSYYVSNDLALKAEEIRNDAFRHQWNVIDDIIVELIKK